MSGAINGAKVISVEWQPNRMAIRSVDHSIGCQSIRMAIRLDRHPFGKEVFVYDGFEDFVVHFENREVSLPFRSLDRTAVRSGDDPFGEVFLREQVYSRIVIDRIVIRLVGNPLVTDDL
ncbi:hypothetical protein HanIR_Chr02g0064091 [Helianthus annuus]|nr:hypothetical protein HanIR_Chr02g0064091 [Helianthus annuus]